MKRTPPVIFSICLFLVAVSIATFADAGSISPASRHGNWAVQSDCTSVYAINHSDYRQERFRVGLGIGCDNGYHGAPDIRVNWYSNLNISANTQLKFKLADNDLASDGWICEKNRCKPKDADNAAKILKQLLANEGPFTAIATDKDQAVQATIDTTGINEAYQALLKHRR